MNKRIKKLWIDALRSGKYKQGRGRLRSKEGNEYCCLGVLCDLAAKEGIGKWDKHHSFVTKITNDGNTFPLYEDSALPTKVRTWAGIKNSTGFSRRGSSLINLNDIKRYNFKEIANVISKNG